MIRQTNRGGGSFFKKVRGGTGISVSPRGKKLKGLSHGVGGGRKVKDRIYLGAQKPGRRLKLAGFVSGLKGRARRFRWNG